MPDALYWLRAQAAHDTEVAERKLAKILARIKPWKATKGSDQAA